MRRAAARGSQETWTAFISHHLLVEESSDGSIVRPIREMRKSRYRRAMRTLALPLAALALLAGCGGTSHVTLAGCLNDAGFLVTSSGSKVDGTSPSGVAFTLRTYRTPAAAKQAARSLDPRTTAVVASGVVDFRGNPDPKAALSPDELRTARSCLGKVQG